MLNIAIPNTALQIICEKNHILKLLLFGSVLRKDFRPDSDIDVLVEFEPGYQPTLFDLAGIQLELSDLFDRPVDVGTPSMLSSYIRDRVLNTAQVIYERT